MASTRSPAAERAAAPGDPGPWRDPRRPPAASEHELLLACARLRLDAPAAQRIRHLVGAGIDWPRLVALAFDHRVFPLLVRALATACADAVPPAAMHELRRHRLRQARDSLHLCGELAAAMALLAARGIPCLAFKGPCLALQAYGDAGLRQFGDLDLLVRPADAASAARALRDEGYREGAPLAPRLLAGTAARRVGMLYPGAHENSYLSPGLAHIDLHWDLHPRCFLPAGAIPARWDRRARVRVAGQTVGTLSAEDALLFLAVHGARDRWCRLGQVCDLAESLLAATAIDWRGLVATADAAGCRRMLLLGVLLACRHLGHPLPRALVPLLRRDRVAATLASVVATNLELSESRRRGRLLAGLAWSLRIHDHWRDALADWAVMIRLALTGSAEGPLPRSAGARACWAFLLAWTALAPLLGRTARPPAAPAPGRAVACPVRRL
jgi:hypothetical protein